MRLTLLLIPFLAEVYRRRQQKEKAYKELGHRNKYIVVDLDRQVILCYEDQSKIFEFDCVSGRDQKNSFPGTYRIYRKEGQAYRSSKYNAPMPYAMFFERDGKAIHGTTLPLLRSYLKYIGIDYGSNGCVGVAEEAARQIHSWTPAYGTIVEILGDEVFRTDIMVYLNVVHLGDGKYSGAANSQLELPAIGPVLSTSFKLTQSEANRINAKGAYLTLLARGSQRGKNSVSINGTIIGFLDAVEQPTWRLNRFKVNDLVKAGNNALRIRAGSDDSDGLDDFEISRLGIQITVDE